MKPALIVVAFMILAAVAAYLVLFPASTFITFKTPGGRGMTFSRTSVALEALPDKYPTLGFAQVPSYVSRLRASRKQKASVIMATADGQHALLLMRYDGQVVLSVSEDRTKANGEEDHMVRFFSNLGMTPVRDYLSANGGVPNSERTCEYALPKDAPAISLLCVSTFTNLFGVGDDHGFEFTSDGLPNKP